MVQWKWLFLRYIEENERERERKEMKSFVSIKFMFRLLDGKSKRKHKNYANYLTEQIIEENLMFFTWTNNNTFSTIRKQRKKKFPFPTKPFNAPSLVTSSLKIILPLCFQYMFLCYESIVIMLMLPMFVHPPPKTHFSML